MHQKAPIWDIPTRLFHWLLVIGIVMAWITDGLGETDWHAWAGYSVLGLILFRLGWGVFGSVHARFTDFVRGPGSVIAYLKGEDKDYRGHNPAGGWSVLVLLVLILAQVLTGLFNTDEEYFSGPLNPLISVDLAGELGVLHEIIFNLILVFAGLHIAAVFLYLYKGDNLITAMITGRHAEREGRAKPVGLWRAIVWGVICAGAVWLMLEMAPKPEVFF